MKLDTILKKIKEEGLLESIRYYFCRLCAKSGMVLAGVYVKNRPSVCENRILFKNRQMQDFTDNARCLFEYLIENGYNEKYQIIWAVSEKKNFKKMKYKNVIFVTAESRHGWTDIRSYYYGNTAKYFFYTNNTADLNKNHCPGQVVVNLWHGCGYKGTTHGKEEIPRSKSMEMFDYALVPGEVFVETKSAYWEVEKNKILPLGYPRYDWLLNKNNNRQQLLEVLFGLKAHGKKLIMWMPTFRKSSLSGYAEERIEMSFEIPGLADYNDLLELNRYCGEQNLLLIIKKHPLQTAWKNQKNLENIQFISDEMLKEKDVQLYSLIGVSDALLSDYSSVAVDYMLLNRPIGFVLADYEQYANTRGFVFENPLEYMPGEKLYNLHDVINFLDHVSKGIDMWKSKRQELLPRMHNRTENYCKRIVNKIIQS